MHQVSVLFTGLRGRGYRSYVVYDRLFGAYDRISYYLFPVYRRYTGKADYILYHDPIRSDRYPFSICEWLVGQIIHGRELPLQAWNSILTFGNNNNLLFYFLLGAFLLEYQQGVDRKECGRIYRWRLPLSGICLVIGLMGLMFIKYRETGLLIWGDTYLSFGYVRLSTALIAIGLYGVCESLFSDRENLASKIIGEYIGQNTLGIYYLHYILLAVFSWTTCFSWLQFLIL